MSCVAVKTVVSPGVTESSPWAGRGFVLQRRWVDQYGPIVRDSFAYEKDNSASIKQSTWLGSIIVHEEQRNRISAQARPDVPIKAA